MRIVLIANSSYETEKLLASCLKHDLPLSGVILVGSERNRNKLIEKVKHYLLTLAVRLKQRLFLPREMSSVFAFERYCIRKANKELKERLKVLKASYDQQDLLQVQSVNSEKVKKYLMDSKPDICMIYGTGIIKKQLLSLAGDCFINAHCSLLPAYRGTKSEFWQCFNEDYDSIGVTFHKVDVGVDTGSILGIIKQEDISFHEPHWLRTKNTLVVIEYFPQIVKAYIDGSISEITQEPTKKLAYKYADITEEKRVKLYKRIMYEVKKGESANR